jgi:hypothetical protein
MLLDQYEPLFFNANFKEAASIAGWAAYRGELIITEGEVADAQGRRKPPQELLKQAVLLSCSDDLKLFAGSLDELQYFPSLLAKYGDDFKPGLLAVFFTVNIDQAFIATTQGVPVVFIPLVQGMVWNELMDLVALDKGDFKGMSAADKVLTLYRALKDHPFRYPELALGEALTRTNKAKRETHGAI